MTQKCTLRTRNTAFAEPTQTKGLQQRSLSAWLSPSYSSFLVNLVHSSQPRHPHSLARKQSLNWWQHNSSDAVSSATLAIPLWHSQNSPLWPWKSHLPPEAACSAFTKFPTPKHNLRKNGLFSQHRDLAGIFLKKRLPWISNWDFSQVVIFLIMLFFANFFCLTACIQAGCVHWMHLHSHRPPERQVTKN